MAKTNGRALKIEKGIPIPEAQAGRPGFIKDAMQAMKEGDSVLIETRALAYQSAHRYLGTGNYAIRPADDGYRVWRTK